MNNKNTRPWILVVEEDEAVRILLSCIIKKIDCYVFLAASGEEGLAIFMKVKFDLVITDLTMPQMDGLTFARKIKESTPDIPVILMTGKDEETVEKKVSDNAVDFVIYKPFEVSKLISLIKQKLFPIGEYITKI